MGLATSFARSIDESLLRFTLMGGVDMTYGECECCGLYTVLHKRGLCAACAFMAEQVEAGVLKPTERE